MRSEMAVEKVEELKAEESRGSGLFGFFQPLETLRSPASASGVRPLRVGPFARAPDP
jgi:hypothetical protein